MGRVNAVCGVSCCVQALSNGSVSGGTFLWLALSSLSAGRVMGDCPARHPPQFSSLGSVMPHRRMKSPFAQGLEPIRIQTRVIAHVDGVGQSADKPADSSAE